MIVVAQFTCEHFNITSRRSLCISALVPYPNVNFTLLLSKSPESFEDGFFSEIPVIRGSPTVTPSGLTFISVVVTLIIIL